MNSKSAAKFIRTLDLFYQMTGQSDTDMTMLLEFSRMNSQEMYAYLEGLGYVYDEGEYGWVFDENF